MSAKLGNTVDVGYLDRIALSLYQYLYVYSEAMSLPHNNIRQIQMKVNSGNRILKMSSLKIEFKPRNQNLLY